MMRERSRLAAAAGLLGLLLAGGCTVLSESSFERWSRQREALEPKQIEGPATGYTDFVGVMHVHTAPYSPDAHGHFEDVVEAAHKQQLDFVVLTEHNTLQHLRDGLQGWHGRTFVFACEEISTDSGHYVALNTTQEIDRTKLTAQEIIDEVKRQGGLGFIAHPYFKHGRWRDWSVTGFTGIEAYNAAHDTLDENKVRLALWTLAAPIEPFYESILDRPYDPLSTWDEMIRRRGPVVGIGATDAHEFHVLGIKFASYDIMFQLVRNHVWIPGPTLTKENFYDALARGHSYLSIELIAPAKGFSYVATANSSVVGVMGDTVAWRPDLQLQITLPNATEMTLFKDGQPIAQTGGASWQFPVKEPGVYRVEVTLRHKPWIYANPIYVTP